MKYLILILIFISCKETDCNRLALDSGYPKYRYDNPTRKCYGVNLLKAELLSEEVKNED